MYSNYIVVGEKDIVQFARDYSGVYIYGCGLCGKAVMSMLSDNGIRVEGFVVTSMQSKGELIDGIEVKCIDDFILPEDSCIIVAVCDDETRNTIGNNLHDHNINEKNIYNREINAWVSETGNFFRDFRKLDILGAKYGTDKCIYNHDYLRKYEFYISKWRDKSFILLELGVFHGESMSMWHDYFKNAEIYGVDIDRNCLKYEGIKQHVIISDLSKIENLEKLKILKPEIIVDDASHFWSHQIKALLTLYRNLPSGGIYICEDLETSFGDYGSNTLFADDEISGYQFLRLISDCVCGDGKNGYTGKYAKEIEQIADETDMISFIRSSCILVRK